MRVAFTLDDLPRWPHAAYPPGYTADSIADKLIEALARNTLSGVYAFANSAPLQDSPELGGILDRWVGAGHHVANHTHSHPDLLGVDAERYIEEIDLAETHLAPWMGRAPGRYFRYTRNHWGDTEEKLSTVRTHLANKRYRIAEVTTWFFEWRWNRAWERAMKRGDSEEAASLRSSFLEFSVAQIRHDAEQLRRWFGRDVPGITLGHNVPFFAEVADEFFAGLLAAGVEFVSLDEVADDPAFERAASGVTDRFLTYQYKLARLAGQDLPTVEPAQQAAFDRVVALSD